MEEWKPVVGWEDFYAVSDLGRVKSIERVISVYGPNGLYRKPVRERIMKPLRGAGAMYMNLNPGAIKRKVHHLVLEAFIGPRRADLITRHLDGDFANNALSNLAYGTQAENRYDAVRHDNHKIPRSVVCAIRSDVGSQRVLAARYGVSRAYVRLVRAGGTRTVG